MAKITIFIMKIVLNKHLGITAPKHSATNMFLTTPSPCLLSYHLLHIIPFPQLVPFCFYARKL